jgi:hypothetical protein
MDVGALSQKVKRQEREADGSPPSSAEAMNDVTVPPLRILLHDVVLK